MKLFFSCEVKRYVYKNQSVKKNQNIYSVSIQSQIEFKKKKIDVNIIEKFVAKAPSVGRGYVLCSSSVVGGGVISGGGSVAGDLVSGSISQGSSLTFRAVEQPGRPSKR